MNEIINLKIPTPAPVLHKSIATPRHIPLGTAQIGAETDLENFREGAAMTYISGGDTRSITPLGVKDDQHVLALGNTRGGKGTSVLVSNTCLWSGSAFVIDPKGENATVTARRRADGSAWCQGMGQRTYLLDPFEVAGRSDDNLEDVRARYNPLDFVYLNHESAIDLVTMIADSLVGVTSEKEPYWERAARSLVKGVILHILTSDEFETHERNLVTVYRLLNAGDQEKKEFLDYIGADPAATAHMLLFSSMERNMAFDGLISAIGEQYKMMAAEAVKQFLGVIETVNKKLEFIESPGMQRVLSESDFELADLKTDPKGVTVFLSLPQRAMETHSGWLRMMTTLTINTMEQMKQQPASGAPVLILLDEFASLRRMRVIETAIAQLAGFGVKLMLGVQSLAQLKDAYKDNWETLVGNCGIKQVLSCEDQFSREYISKLAGETEVLRVTYNSSDSTTNSTSTADTTRQRTHKILSIILLKPV